MTESLVQSYCRECNKQRRRRRYAKQMAIDFAVRNRLIEFEKYKTGSSIPEENIRITRCFSRCFEKRDIPETITEDSGRTYIWNFPNK